MELICVVLLLVQDPGLLARQVLRQDRIRDKGGSVSTVRHDCLHACVRRSRDQQEAGELDRTLTSGMVLAVLFSLP